MHQPTAPRFEAVDPLKDIQADILAVRAGVMTLKEAIARQRADTAPGAAIPRPSNPQGPDQTADASTPKGAA